MKGQITFQKDQKSLDFDARLINFLQKSEAQKNLVKNYMAVDQYGQVFHDLGAYPRKELLNRLGRKRAEKMFIDGINGEPCHVGYVIAGHWLSLYETIRFIEK